MNNLNEDGKVWLFYSSYQAGLRLVELNPKTGHLKKNPPDITTVSNSLGESAFAIKGPEYYYLFAFRGICCKGLESRYHLVMGRSKDIKGPYLNKDGKNWVDNNYSLFFEDNPVEPGRGQDFFQKMIRPLFCIMHLVLPL